MHLKTFGKKKNQIKFQYLSSDAFLSCLRVNVLFLNGTARVLVA